nr:S1C family serine protease [Pirellula sp.]
PGNREQAIDSLTAKLSKRRWGFRSGYQHDCSIAANDCGGPLIDLEGELIGINIARSGRIQSFAIPISDVKQFVENSIARGDAR